MWRSRGRTLLLLGLLTSPLPADARVCLPGIFEGGARLGPPEQARVLSLGLLLRQHEACRSRPSAGGGRRVFVFGNSGVFGYPHFHDETAVGLVDARFAEEGAGVRVFNLAMVSSSATRDAVILRSALAFEPDVVVYAVSLSDFRKTSFQYPPLWRFFQVNADVVERFAVERPPGLADPLALAATAGSGGAPGARRWRDLREVGSLIRTGAGVLARRVRRAWFPGLPREKPEPAFVPERYDCEAVKATFAEDWQDWSEWSVLPYLEGLREERGIDVLVVNWPSKHDPVGDCHNRRYPRAAYEAYDRWLAAEASTRGLGYLDLHDLLPASEFRDSVHPTAAGQRRVAMHLHAELARRMAAGAR